MGSVERRLRRLEAQTPAARGEEEVRAEACARMSWEDLTTLEETCQRLDELGGGEFWDDAAWEKLTEDERVAFYSAWRRYEELDEEARAGR